MQLASCNSTAARGPGLSTYSGQGPSLRKITAWPRKKPAAAAVRRSAFRRDEAEFSCGDGGREVDEGMAVLRRRIDEVRAAELSWEQPAEWAAWEDELYSAHEADAWHLVGALQAVLMSEHPAVGVGIIAALALSVPASAFALVSHLLHASWGLFSNLPH